MEPDLQQLQQYYGTSISPNNKGSYIPVISNPLIFQPGEGWTYSPGLGWVGKLVERISGHTLEEYMKKNIWELLGMKHISFFPGKYEALVKRRISIAGRDGQGRLILCPEIPQSLFFEADINSGEAYGGGGCWSSAESFVPLLQSICANDGRVLVPSLVDEMFRPQLPPGAKEALNHDAIFKATFGTLFNMDSQPVDSGLGGEVNMIDEPGQQRAGTMYWFGLPNVICWIDRKAGLYGLYFSQLLPMGDAKVNELFVSFQKAIYAKFGH